jgi:hypothetical protein
MGKVIFTFKDHTESFRCKNQDKADAIASKRPHVLSHKFYAENESIPRPTKKRVVEHKMSIEEMEYRISRM